MIPFGYLLKAFIAPDMSALYLVDVVTESLNVDTVTARRPTKMQALGIIGTKGFHDAGGSYSLYIDCCLSLFFCFCVSGIICVERDMGLQSHIE